MGEKRKRSISPSVADIEPNGVEADECGSKRTKTETALEEPHTPQPLTEENLRLLQGLPAVSPPKKSSMGDDTTESSSTKVSIDIRELLRFNQLLMNEEGAFDRYPRIKAKCEELIMQERNTGITGEEIDKILNELPLMEEVNEDTFIELVWPALIRRVRHKKESGLNKSAEQGEALILTAWEEDHLACVRNQVFDANRVPVLDPGNNNTLKGLLLSLPKLKAPKPNYCYGLLQEAFTPEERILNNDLRQYTVLSHPLYHCFFAVVFTTLDGNWIQIKTQCCRAGAAMVHATEQLRKAASSGNEHPLKDDHLKKEQCMAFTLAVNPLYSQLNLHWAEPTGKSTKYHMHRVRNYLMGRGGELKNLRHDINCILDWGCVDRKTSIQEILAKIKAKRDSMPTSSLSTPSSKDGEKGAADENRECVNQAGYASEA